MTKKHFPERYTRKVVEGWIEELRKTPPGGEVRDVYRRLGVPMRSFYDAFQRLGLAAPGDYIGATAEQAEGIGDDPKRTIPAPPPVVEAPRGPSVAKVPIDPVAAHRAREEGTRDKGAIRELVERLNEAEARQRFLDAMTGAKGPPKILRFERASGLREMTAVAAASDWHPEEPVDPEAVSYRNKYSLEIADERIKRFFAGFIDLVQHHRASNKFLIRQAILWLGGDLMSGYIHPELVETAALSPTEVVRWLLPRLRDGIATVLETLALDRLVIPCSHGNHGRTTDKIRISTGAINSFEWLMYWSLADEFRNEKRITFEITKSAHQYVQIEGSGRKDWTLHVHHGDDVRYQGGVGGLGIPLLKAVPMWDLVHYADYHMIGHWHQLRDYGRAIVNGSLIGFSPYSMRIRAEFEPPQQAFWLLDSAKGKCMFTPLWVGESQAT